MVKQCPRCNGNKTVINPDSQEYELITCPICEGRGYVGPICPGCGSTHTMKNGIKVTKRDGEKHRYLCRGCGKTFYAPEDWEE